MARALWTERGRELAEYFAAYRARPSDPPEPPCPTREPDPTAHGPWYRQGSADWGAWDHADPAFRRLFSVAGELGVEIWPLMVGARRLVELGVCDRSEAWDRLAFNLRRMRG